MDSSLGNPEPAKKSLGWVLFKASSIKIEHGQVKYQGQWFGLGDSYDLAQYKDQIKTGSFVQDARGR